MKIICLFSIIFTIIVLGVFGYLYIADLWGINDLLFSLKFQKTTIKQKTAGDLSTKKNSLINSDKIINLNSEQKTALQKIGIDPETLPKTITPEMEKCFTEKLGEKRVKEIEAGISPNYLDLLKSSSCLK